MSIDRAKFMLGIAAKYIRDNCDDELIHYDEADCDGACVADDCDYAADYLSALSTPPREHADELVEAVISIGDALEHALYQLPEDCNQILGMKGALKRAATLLAKIKEQTDE